MAYLGRGDVDLDLLDMGGRLGWGQLEKLEVKNMRVGAECHKDDGKESTSLRIGVFGDGFYGLLPLRWVCNKCVVCVLLKQRGLQFGLCQIQKKCDC